jgi:aerobic carbon-monoxide dehydrogenase medium subunit
VFTRAFRYERAERYSDACDLLREHGDEAKVIAGGQSLLPMINLGLVQPGLVVDISRLAEGRELTVTGDGYLVLGALVTHARLAADPAARAAQPLLPAAAGQIGNTRVRNRGTLGGSLAHADPAAELPLVMVALGATYEVTTGRASREIRAEDFHLGFFTTRLDDDELIVSVRAPVLGPGWGWSFQEVARRDGDFAMASAAALIRSANGLIIESRVAVGGVSDRPLRLADVETALTGCPAGDLAERVGPIQGISPADDTSASAQYRARLTRVLVIRALAEAAGRAGEVA